MEATNQKDGLGRFSHDVFIGKPLEKESSASRVSVNVDCPKISQSLKSGFKEHLVILLKFALAILSGFNSQKWSRVVVRGRGPTSE